MVVPSFLGMTAGKIKASTWLSESSFHSLTRVNAPSNTSWPLAIWKILSIRHFLLRPINNFYSSKVPFRTTIPGQTKTYGDINGFRQTTLPSKCTRQWWQPVMLMLSSSGSGIALPNSDTKSSHGYLYTTESTPGIYHIGKQCTFQTTHVHSVMRGLKKLCCISSGTVLLSLNDGHKLYTLGREVLHNMMKFVL